jgi:hypothetical protein
MGASFVDRNTTITVTITNATSASPITTGVPIWDGSVSIPTLTVLVSVIGLALLIPVFFYICARRRANQEESDRERCIIALEQLTCSLPSTRGPLPPTPINLSGMWEEAWDYEGHHRDQEVWHQVESAADPGGSREAHCG